MAFSCMHAHFDVTDSIHDKQGTESLSCVMWTIQQSHSGSFSPVHPDLPVGLSCHINIVQVSSVVLRVCPSQHQLPSYFCGRVSGGR